MYTVQWIVYPKKGDIKTYRDVRPAFTISSLDELKSSAITELDNYSFLNDLDVVEGHFKVFQHQQLVKDEWFYYYFGYLNPEDVA